MALFCVYMKYIVFVNGYRTTESIIGASGKRYLFRKKFVTAVDNIDSEGILSKTSKDISWCPKTSRTEMPFYKLETFCKQNNINIENYLKTHLLN